MRQLTQADVGTTLGVSPWITLTQEDVDAFGHVTRDIDPFHMNPDWAGRNSPFGTTIVYGFQTLSMLTFFIHQVLEWPSGLDQEPSSMALNYGFDKVRFLEPVPVNQPIRCQVALLSLEHRHPGETLKTLRCEVEVQGATRPALVADWKSLFVQKDAQERIQRDLPAA